MAPETRSRGAAPPSSRVYNSSPSLQQVQFPARRKIVRPPRDHSHDGDETKLSAAAALKLKQETLTQLGFVQSSFEEGYEGLDFEESEAEEMQRDPAKENRRPKRAKKEEESDDDEPPVSSRRRKRKNDTKIEGEKRRRTLGDGEVNRLKDEDEDEDEPLDRKSRRRTLGDIPSSRYHTQTLTQFMGRDHPLLVLDSDDEPTANDGFDAWLSNEPENHTIPSSSPSKQPPRPRQESIIPQTPTKPIRTEVPSSSQQVTPLSGMMLERYGAPNATQMSPSSAVAARRVKRVDEPSVNAGPTPVTGTPVRRKLVVEDSYATENLISTPSKSMAERGSQEIELGEMVAEVASSTPRETPRPKRSSGSQGANKASSVKRVRISSASPLKSSPKKVVVIADGRMEIPDSEEENEDFEEEEEAEEQVEDQQQETFPAGEETQFIMDQMAVQETSTHETTITSSPPLRRSTPRPQTTNTSPADTLPRPPSTPSPPFKPLRKPLPPPPASTQPFESQRLPTSLVQSFPIAAHRTDAILPLSPSDLTLITTGHKLSLTLPFRMINTVVRFWFWDGTEIKYGASLDDPIHHHHQGTTETWEYPLPQVYELNNPLDETELAIEHVFCRKITRCGYMPPSIASGMLWNIARTLFPDNPFDEEPQSDPLEDHKTPTKAVAPPSRTQGSTASGPGLTVSQEVEAQLQSDIAHSTQFQSEQILVPSTPEDYQPTPRPSHHPTARTATEAAAQTIRPSQATTASQCSTPSPIKPSPRKPTNTTPLPPPSFTNPKSTEVITNDSDNPLPIPSSSSLVFQDYSAPSPIAPHLLVALGSSSQLLSKSQMLSDSLLREDDDDDQGMEETRRE